MLAVSLFRCSAWGLILLSSVSSATALNDDGLSLLALKSAISVDPTRALHSWLESDHEPCGWSGVACRGGRVTAVSLSNLSLEGYLPSEMSLLSALEKLSFSHNRFSGQMPSSIGLISGLIALDLSYNNLSGPVPVAIGGLTSLVHLDLSSNYLDGPLPLSIAAFCNLAGVLNLSYNAFSGEIPPEYGNLPVVVSLDLRHNRLTGEIPEVGSLLNQGPTAFAGNPGLCGFPLKNQCYSVLSRQKGSFNLSSPVSQREMYRERHRQPAVMIAILVGISITALLSVIVLQWQLRRSGVSLADIKSVGKSDPGGSPARKDRGEEIYVAVDESFGLDLEELLRSSAYVVGKSRSGIVYKVLVGSGSPASAVAVRRITLHGGKSPPVPWAPKLTILQGAAKALAYLHERKHVHGNLRSTKILLDDDLRPYLSGFGITRLQRRGGVGIRAEGGYSAPELSGKAASAATQSGDVYAFGVLMMEAATGKKAEMELVEWVRQASSEERSMSQLIGEVQVNPQLMAVLRLALWCTESDPEARPRMKVVVESLDRIGPES
ncbi:hypothetical protein HPP92_017835 [Vanilla planifolia]|uniref:Protein kinase domain-containing protein n=1 Tax=Vanilla planifolia TaxID=51239 RepID=A0A835UMS1_VANPL|nr:hypothetical protein HPP92_017835 [Vanilla planifolia]